MIIDQINYWKNAYQKIASMYRKILKQRDEARSWAHKLYKRVGELELELEQVHAHALATIHEANEEMDRAEHYKKLYEQAICQHKTKAHYYSSEFLPPDGTACLDCGKKL